MDIDDTINQNIINQFTSELELKYIGDLLEIKDIKSTIRDFEKDEVHSMHLTDSLNRTQETNMLTEQGLYKLLMISRKPIAKQFQKLMAMDGITLEFQPEALTMIAKIAQKSVGLSTM